MYWMQETAWGEWFVIKQYLNKKIVCSVKNLKDQDIAFLNGFPIMKDIV